MTSDEYLAEVKKELLDDWNSDPNMTVEQLLDRALHSLFYEDTFDEDEDDN